ncbi:hypothetical protein [Williamsia sterculiae]|uniref:NlpC/P60 family protein n=1 Tax=Williamsia sterculiae TaxID=1344003 RepID=A0A1N7H9Z9_9NOCA|nr:hypothetical protein [Williamsia sterculiae]SIS21686.1 hypothetical protein SAMN05445060_3811 [Williamsia sterculiae]
MAAIGAVLVGSCGFAASAQADTPAADVGHFANGGVAIARGATLLHTNTFGKYGCEDFVDAAYGRTTANGIPHDGAIAFYQQLAARGLGHSSLPAPTGALVFSQGEDGGHVDIAIGNGQYLSGGVQGLSPGWGDRTDIQILPSANLGSFRVVGWAYAPWSSVGL